MPAPPKPLTREQVISDIKDLGRVPMGLLDILAGAAKGSVSATAGLPGDIESLVRMIPGLKRQKNLSSLVTGQRETFLPTSEEVSKALPPVIPAGASPQRQASAQFGQDVGAFIPPPVSALGQATAQAGKTIGRGALQAGRAVAQDPAVGAAVERAVQRLAPAATPMYAVKPKGGSKLVREPEPKVDSPYERSLAQGYEHGWFHGTTGDIRSFDPSRRGEATGAASAKKGFFFVRDPIAPPEEMLEKSSDPKIIEMVKRALQKEGIPDEKIEALNKRSFEGNAAETASGYSSIGGSRTYKDAMKKANEAEKRGDWDEYHRQMQIAEDSEMTRLNEAQELVAKYGERRDEMTDAIQKALYDRVLPQKEAEQLDAWYKSYMPYGWYNLYGPEQFEGLKKALVSKIGEEKAAPAIEAMNRFESVRAERNFSEKSQEGANVMPVALRYKNPYVYDFKGSNYRDQTYSDLVDQTILGGHDALILRNTFDPGGGPAKLVDIGVVFDPAQIRSTFAKFNPKDIKSADITKNRGGAVRKADGGEVTEPDMTDGGKVIDGGDFRKGGKVRISDNPDTMALELAGGGKVGAFIEGVKAVAKPAEKAPAKAAKKAEKAAAQTASKQAAEQTVKSIYPQADALERARQNAVKMLGLPENNTAMDRARAMGFDDNWFHGTNRDFPAFENSMLGAKTGAKSAQKAHFLAKNPELSNTYVNTENVFPLGYKAAPPVYESLFKNKDAFAEFNAAPDWESQWRVLEKYGMNYGSGQVMPLMVRLGNQRVKDYGGAGYRDVTYNDELKAAKKGKKDSVVFKNTFDPGPHEGRNVQTDVAAIFDPSRIRSRFAAFDPAEMDKSDLLKKKGGKVSVTNNLDTMRLAVQKRK